MLNLVSGEAHIPDQLQQEYQEACGHAAASLGERNRNPPPFSFRMSNIGRPICQLQRDALGIEKVSGEYNSAARLLYGHMAEAMLVMFMKSAGCNVTSEQERVSLDIGDTIVYGTYDIAVDHQLWDIKSASPWAFKNKFKGWGGFADFASHDTFGYVDQGLGYQHAKGEPFRGWIAMDKSAGEIATLETPRDFGDKDVDLARFNDKYNSLQKLIKDAENLVRPYEPADEMFGRKPTGNKIISRDSPCYFCDYKEQCWEPTVLPSLPSKAASPMLSWYVEINNDFGKL